MHGYDLRKRLRGEFGLLSSLSFGSLYPALARLESDGAVRELSCEPPDQLEQSPPGSPVFPLTGSIAGERAALRARLTSRRSAPARAVGTRGRKVYELTERGERLFNDLLIAEGPRSSDGRPGDGREFALRWAFARHLDGDARMRLLERRRADLVLLRDGAKAAEARTGRPLDRFEQSLAEHARSLRDHDLAWIDRLIASERATRSGLAPETTTAATAVFATGVTTTGRSEP